MLNIGLIKLYKLSNWRNGDDERKRLFNSIVTKHQKNNTKTVITRGTKNNLDHALKVVEHIDLDLEYK